MQVKGHKSKSRKRKLEGTSTSDRSVLIDDNGEIQCGGDVCLWTCTHYLLCHCCSGPTSALLCNAVRHLQILMTANPSSLRAGTATSWNYDDNHRVSRCIWVCFIICAGLPCAAVTVFTVALAAFSAVCESFLMSTGSCVWIVPNLEIIITPVLSWWQKLVTSDTCNTLTHQCLPYDISLWWIYVLSVNEISSQFCCLQCCGPSSGHDDLCCWLCGLGSVCIYLCALWCLYIVLH